MEDHHWRVLRPLPPRSDQGRETLVKNSLRAPLWLIVIPWAGFRHSNNYGAKCERFVCRTANRSTTHRSVEVYLRKRVCARSYYDDVLASPN
jgi:transposase